MLCGLTTMQQASSGDGLSFDPFPFDEDGLAASEVDVGRCQVAQALVVSQMIVVGDEGSDLGFEVARRISFTTRSAGSLTGMDFCLIFAPSKGYDEPETLPS
jgi:hypothetical protein